MCIRDRNNTSDDIFLYDGDSQGAGILIDSESYSGDEIHIYNIPEVLGCPIPAPKVYIASSFAGGDLPVAEQCELGGEYVELCATEGCVNCPEVTVNLAGWEIEDRISNDGSPSTSIIINSGTLRPAECVTIFSGYRTGEIAGSLIGTAGSVFDVGTDRNDCPIWNDTGDDIFLYDGDSQGDGILIDSETYTSDGITNYTPLTMMGCPPACSDALTSLTAPQIRVINSACTTFGGSVSDGRFEAPLTSCPDASMLQYSTDNMNWGTSIPVYDQENVVTVYTRCICEEDEMIISQVSSVSSVLGQCPVCPSLVGVAPSVVISFESTCDEFGGNLTGGVFSEPSGTCPEGSTLQYSSDNVNWGTTIPLYDQENEMTVYTRCICDETERRIGRVNSVTSTPGSCPPCPTLTDAAPSVVISFESTCVEYEGTPEGGIISLPDGTCPDGSSITYSVNGGAFTTDLPVYDQTNQIIIITRCECNNDNTIISPTSIEIVTNPGACPIIEPLTTDDLSVTDPCNCDNPLNVVDNQLGTTLLFHDLLTVNTSPDVLVTLTANDGNLLDRAGNAIPVGTTIAQSATGSGIYRLAFFTRPNQPASVTVSNMVSTENFTTASCAICTDIIPTMSQWGLMIFGLLVVNMGVLLLRRQEVLFSQ